MHHPFVRTIRLAVLLFTAALLAVGGAPLVVVAEDGTGVVPTETAQTPELVVIDPAVTPVEPEMTYEYNSETGHWDSNKWYFDPATGTYQPTPQPEPDPVVAEAPAPEVVEPTSEPLLEGAELAPETTVLGTETDLATELTNVNQTEVNNTLNADATSGDALVSENTTAGNAISGDAESTTTILNQVNSVLSLEDNKQVATFTTDVMGDVNGDIILQPILLKTMLESAAADQVSSNIVNTNEIENNVNLTATSGDATVTGNTSAGDATTGSANTVANIVNIINSMVAANQSFVGNVNIYGNLNGDILIAPDFIPQLLASNGGQLDANNSQTSVVVDSSDTLSIINNISLAAQSGLASVVGNTKAGDATTGDATTNVVIFNLSGHAIVASNSLLVFVNVLGRWVGVIVDAPEGATAAVIGNGVSSDTVTAPDLVIKSDTNTEITNNISLTSQTGDATVSKNTSAGSAKTGDATASVNLSNIVNSQFSLSGWFGVLFINVFGNWFGSFGVDTTAGGTVTPGTSGNQDSEATGGSETETPQVIRFVPSTTPQASVQGAYHNASNITLVSQNGEGNYVATDLAQVVRTESSESSESEVLAATTDVTKQSPSYILPVSLGLVVIAGIIFGIIRRRQLANSAWKAYKIQ